MAYVPSKPYIPTEWLDHIIDPERIDPMTGKPVVIQEGTRFKAFRMNNIEDGILGAWAWLKELQREVDRHAVYLAIDGRGDGNNGTFFDTIDDKDPHLLMYGSARGRMIAEHTAGTTTLTLDSVQGFQVHEEITITDDVAFEYVLVTAVDAEAKTITVNQLTNTYKKGAVVGRSTAVRNETAGRLEQGNLTTYSVAIA